MQVETTALEGVLLLKPAVFEDHRGQYVQTYAEEEYRRAGIAARFVEDDISVSKRHVLRGIHGDAKTWKLVSCLHGRFYLVVVDCRAETPGFGKWAAFTLSDRNRHQVLIPPGFGNGHAVLSSKAIFHYKQSEYYDPKRQFTYRWDEPRFAIWWPVSNPILSQRDQLGRFVDR
jgi:dTDP-4-dehydrorhamnose 3,5-epimerase